MRYQYVQALEREIRILLRNANTFGFPLCPWCEWHIVSDHSYAAGALIVVALSLARA